MTQDKILIFRSWKSNFDHGDIDHALEVYSDDELGNIGAHGYNAIWLRGLFRDVVPSSIFPEFGSDHQRYIDILNTLVIRAKTYNIGVYLYVNEPAGFPITHSFWHRHPEVIGAKALLPHHDRTREGEEFFYALCTSTKEVKTYLKESAYNLFSLVKGLAGLITISASERQSHCFSHIDCTGHYGKGAFSYFYPPEYMACTRCQSRHPSDIVAELNNLMYDGMKTASPTANMACWNWSWNLYEAHPFDRIISQMDKDILIMADFERGGKKIYHGHEQNIDEYSLAYIGPSERAQSTFNAAHKYGHRTMAKLQVGTTHELATVPSLPLLHNLWAKIRYLNENNIEGVMACWNMGNMLSLNTFITGWALKNPNEFPALKDLVMHYFPDMPDDQYSLMGRAWTAFEEAMDYYPFNMSFLYSSAMNYALGYWLPPEQISGDKKLGRSWLMDERGNDFSDSFTESGLDETISALKELAEHWQKGLHYYQQAFSDSSDQRSIEEYTNAILIGCCFRSACHVYQMYRLCMQWRNEYLPIYTDLCQAELENCELALPFLEQDKRFGFHCECHDYMFDYQTVYGKIHILTTFLNETAV